MFAVIDTVVIGDVQITLNSLAVDTWVFDQAPEIVTTHSGSGADDTSNDVGLVDTIDPPIKQAMISDLFEDGYALLRPIPVVVERSEDGAMAQFQEANIAIGGTSDQDAFQSLFAEILDTFDTLMAEEQNGLGPDAARQLGILRTFIVKA